MRNKIFLLLIIISSLSLADETKPSITAPMAARGGAIAIPDDSYDGTTATMACATVAGPGGLITDMNVDLDLEHTWAGDLVIKVIAPDLTTLTLMSRPGFAEPADDGTGCCGDSSDFQAGNIINFVNGGATSAEDAGSTILGAEFICATDGLCEYAPAPDTGPGTDFSDFFGLESAGNWSVCIGDAGLGDTGNLISANINFTVPAVRIPSLSVYGIIFMIGLIILMMGYRVKRRS